MPEDMHPAMDKDATTAKGGKAVSQKAEAAAAATPAIATEEAAAVVLIASI